MKNAITLLKKACYKSNSQITETEAWYEHKYVLDLFSLSSAIPAPIDETLSKIEELILEGYIYPLNTNENNIHIETDFFKGDISIPTFSPTRKFAHIAIECNSFIKRDELKEICESIINTIEETIQLSEKQKSSLVIRAHGEATKRKNVKSLIRFGVEIELTDSEKLDVWKALNFAKHRGAQLCYFTKIPICLNFNNQLTNEFQDEHFILFKNREHIHKKDKLSASSTSDKPTLDAVNSITTDRELEKKYHRPKTSIAMENLFLSLPTHTKAFGLNNTFNTEAIRQHLLNKGVKPSEPEFLYYSRNLHPDLKLFIYNQFGSKIYNQTVSVSNNKTTQRFHACEPDHLYLLNREICIQKNNDKEKERNKKVQKNKKNTNTRYIAIYDPSYDKPKLLGFRKCTNRTSNNIKLFHTNLEFICFETRQYISKPFMIVDCNEAQSKEINTLCELFPNKNNAFIISDNTLHAAGTRYPSKALMHINKLKKLFDIFEWTYNGFLTTHAPGGDEYDHCYYHRLKDVKLIYTQTQMNTLDKRTLPLLKVFDGLKLITSMLKNNGLVYLSYQNIELSHLFTFDSNDDSVTITNKSHLLHPFTITFTETDVIINIKEHNTITVPVNYNRNQHFTDRPMSILEFLNNIHRYQIKNEIHPEEAKSTQNIILKSLKDILPLEQDEKPIPNNITHLEH